MINLKIKWINLKSNKCPKCGKDLQWSDEPENMNCGTGFFCSCGFSIREKTFRKIVNSQITNQLEKEWNKEFGYENN